MVNTLETIFALVDAAVGEIIEARGYYNSREHDAFEGSQTAALRTLSKAMGVIEDELVRLDVIEADKRADVKKEFGIVTKFEDVWSDGR